MSLQVEEPNIVVKVFTGSDGDTNELQKFKKNYLKKSVEYCDEVVDKRTLEKWLQTAESVITCLENGELKGLLMVLRTNTKTFSSHARITVKPSSNVVVGTNTSFLKFAKGNTLHCLVPPNYEYETSFTITGITSDSRMKIFPAPLEAIDLKSNQFFITDETVKEVKLLCSQKRKGYGSLLIKTLTNVYPLAKKIELKAAKNAIYFYDRLGFVMRNHTIQKKLESLRDKMKEHLLQNKLDKFYESNLFLKTFQQKGKGLFDMELDIA